MAKFPVVLLIVGVSCLYGVLCKSNIPKIAIIGGGIGGTSSAYFLRELFGADTKIDLYESKTIGGRLATKSIDGNFYETGGAIIHPRNKYMLEFLKKFSQAKRKSSVFSQFGLYDGTEFLYTESKWEIISIIKLLWRYGYGPVKLQAFIDDMLRKFSRIYVLQENQQCYKTVADMLGAMGHTLAESTALSTDEGFTKSGFSERVVDELVMATLAANYGQNTSVHQFVGMVSVAGASTGLWAVEGGNKRIPEELLSQSRAQYIKSEVTRVVFNPTTKQYTLETRNQKAFANQSVYDIVVVATPLTSDVSRIRFVNFTKELSFPGEYHRTVCTIVKGKVDFSYFGFDEDDQMIDEVLYVNFDGPFHSIGRINAVDHAGGGDGEAEDPAGRSNVWKLFSRLPIADEDLKKAFVEIDSKHAVDWLAYPRYGSTRRRDSFELHSNVYHVNAIEWAASAMEMSVIGAKNVALLAYKAWNDMEYVDSSRRFGDEL